MSYDNKNSSQNSAKKVILLLNMGGPNDLSEVSVFLKNMFNDPYILSVKPDFLRKILANLITKMRTNSATQNYIKLGGKSPINNITKSLCEKTKKFANEQICVDFIMNYTPPFADEVVQKYAKFDEIFLLPLYPHFSQTTVKSSLESTEISLKKHGIKNYKILDIFYQNGQYNEIILNLIKEKIANLSKDEISQISLIFSAHSLPQKIIDNGDPYEAQMKEHAQILSNLLEQNGIKFKEIILAYQSRLGPVKWLGPNTAEVLENLSGKKALIFPIAFCVDNSETDFELSILYKELAQEKGFEYYEVCRCPNDSDEFAKFILDYAK
ncbi:MULTISPECIES: ferrochelatase [unclassified Campylobacter]|uniref:ferrochelatase n=1 Tax=unclassified Campylobacter TaxID=2593542 RepID=UPI0022E9D29E|nr:MULTISPECIES: ferrochelatase [unclassified Campylobacter]MDA3080792.1 ferrochelatase [Campylobacter sp. CS_NA1]MDA3085004.1 ferrochelatase [Campylobacter sp. CS_ED1]MDA3089780.1 ferrochelatase [Campylobacter sp. CS_ED2]